MCERMELVHLRLARLRVGLRGASQLRCCQRLASIPQFMPSMLSETLVLSVTDTRAVRDWHQSHSSSPLHANHRQWRRKRTLISPMLKHCQRLVQKSYLASPAPQCLVEGVRPYTEQFVAVVQLRSVHRRKGNVPTLRWHCLEPEGQPNRLASSCA